MVSDQRSVSHLIPFFPSPRLDLLPLLPDHVRRSRPHTLPPAVLSYIEALEAELERLTASAAAADPPWHTDASAAAEPAEPPTTLNVITISAGRVAKRTPRHLYNRQRRGGMGVFDLETPRRPRPPSSSSPT